MAEALQCSPSLPSLSPPEQVCQWITDLNSTRSLSSVDKNHGSDWKLLDERSRGFSECSSVLLLRKDAVHEKDAFFGDAAFPGAARRMLTQGSFVEVQTSFDESAEMPGEANLEDAMKEALRMACEGVYIPRNSLVHLINRCIDEGDSASCYDMHYLIQVCGLDSDAFIGSHLIRMFSAFGFLTKAAQVFGKLLNPDVFTWNAIISAYTNLGYFHQAIHSYNIMRELGLEPDGHVLVIALKACCGIGSVEQGYHIHSNIIENGLESEVYVASTLIDMYVQCGNLEKACHVFGKSPQRNVVTWSILVAGYLHSGYVEQALLLLERMEMEGIQPNDVTLACALKTCCLDVGRQIHAHIVGQGHESDGVVGSSLINMYAKCKSSKDMSIMFERLQTKDVITWNSLITSYLDHEQERCALELFKQMQKKGIEPNVVTFITSLKACSKLGDVEQGMDIHSSMIKTGLELDVYTGSSLIDMYAKCGCLKDAQSTFHVLPNQNVVTWSAMISGFCQHGQGKEAFQYYKRMKQEGVKPNAYTIASLLSSCSSLLVVEEGVQMHMNCIEFGFHLDTYVGNALIDMYAKCGNLQHAYRIFNQLPNRDVVTWSSLIAGCAQNQEGQEAIQLYVAMQNDGMEPNIVTFITVLKACSSIAALEQGRLCHSYLINNGFNLDVYVGSALIDMYTKCGCLEEACIVFHMLPKRDTAIWSAVINGYAQHNDYESALQYFDAMQQAGVQPDSVTFLNILSACGNALLVREGCSHLKSMIEIHNIVPAAEHLNCVVDLLGNAKLLSEAIDLLESIPFGSNVVGWMSLLSSCRMHANVEIGRSCFNHIVTVDKENVACYVLMSSIYSSAGMESQAKLTDELRLVSNGWKKPGKAYIEVDDVVHSFVVGDRQHEKIEQIYAKLKDLNMKMQIAGHGPYTGLISGKKDENVLCGHCEKLALAFGLLHTPEGTTIRISKNLRMCPICHSDTKFISMVEKREIIIVDTRCVHRFQDGQCACNMYTDGSLSNLTVDQGAIC